MKYQVDHKESKPERGYDKCFFRKFHYSAGNIRGFEILMKPANQFKPAFQSEVIKESVLPEPDAFRIIPICVLLHARFCPGIYFRGIKSGLT